MQWGWCSDPGGLEKPVCATAQPYERGQWNPLTNGREFVIPESEGPKEVALQKDNKLDPKKGECHST